jgi:adenine-specific DNA-methyltransferase
MKKQRTPKPVDISSVKHRDKRSNIPTQELRDFVKADESTPKKMLYPRDPSLDPQLVWKGKDEQDRHPLEVPVVPVYIQEKIHPQALIENLRDTARAGEPEPEQLLFADFNGIKFEDLIDFYRHEQNWTNRMILGDSLLVMSSLAEKEGLKGKVQMIYFDPPYGIKFGSNWQVSTRKRDVKDGKVEDATRQPEQIRAFRDTWELGIHSYLAYLRDRLVAARDLLTDSGSVFVQIGDENIHLVRCTMDEVFGSDNFCNIISFKKTGGLIQGFMPAVMDYLIWYAKKRDDAKFRQLYFPKEFGSDTDYQHIELENGERRRLTFDEARDPSLLPNKAKVFQTTSLESENPIFEFDYNGRSYTQRWKTNRSGLHNLANAGRLFEATSKLRYVRYVEDFPVMPVVNSWADTGSSGYRDPNIYVVQTTTRVVERCIAMTTDPGDLVFDPTCGSGTTAYVAEQWGRRWITIDTSRVALALARTRLMCAKYPYYLLSDSPEGVQKEGELTGKVPPSYKTDKDIRKGFVYKRVPHVTLKSIANNPEIREGMTRDEIDRAIAKYADTEVLYDHPYEDGKRIRVTGPFTVESLSPHRALSSTDYTDDTDEESRKENLCTSASSVDRFIPMIIENLRKAGVQNTKKQERLTFDRLEPYAGTWLHAAGEYTEKGGKAKRVAVCIGPEHGTVGPDLVKEAAKEALKGVGFDLLIVCGFAFDAHAAETALEFTPDLPKVKAPSDSFAVAEESRDYGRLPVLLARMNPDLAMGDDLLKKTGAANLFMVFGEPDIRILSTDGTDYTDGSPKMKKKESQETSSSSSVSSVASVDKIAVEVFGVDVYDPTTGQIRSSSTDDIACWFIDTNYNGESFFVRHAYFTGAGDPYEKLKRALRAEIDESAWSALYTTKSRPFAKPETGKIAVKVINHYGDEVMKVYEVQ